MTISRNLVSESKHVNRKVLSALVVFSMLFAGFAALASVTMSPSTSHGIQISSSGPRSQSVPAAACGEVPVPLGSASTYAALSGAGITNTGPSKITGDIGAGPGSSITGFPPGTYSGTENVANTASAGAEANLTTAFNNASGRSNCAVAVAGNIGGQTLTPGLYKSTSTLAISSGDLTLSGNGVFIFQAASSLTVTSGRSVILTNGSQAGSIFWVLGSSAALGTTVTMKGTIMAYASVTMDTGTSLDGRALARTGDVTLANTTIVVPNATASSADYAVTFTEHSLPSGTSWSVTLNGVLESSVTPTIGFSVANGTYAYSVGTTTGYTANPSSGAITVNGAAIGQTIAFTTSVGGDFPVMFTESGLTTGTNWAVTFNGVSNGSSSTTIGFRAANGSYTYSVSSVNGFSSSPSSGSVTVRGASTGQSIEFTSTAAMQTYGVTFTETGLAAGASWTVSLGGVLRSSAATTVEFNEPSGTYTFLVPQMSGFQAAQPWTGSITVNGAATGQAVAFVPSAIATSYYVITFTETGLNAGSNWTVTLGGIQKTTTTPTLLFTVLNGSESYSVGASAGYTMTPSSGDLNVNGIGLNSEITYTSTGNGGGSSGGNPGWFAWADIGLLLLVVLLVIVAVLLLRQGRTPSQ
jgi:hypothetical protein